MTKFLKLLDALVGFFPVSFDNGAERRFLDGEKQRIGNSRVFMRLLTGRTRLLLLDEPNSALDSDAERKLFENILSHRQGMTVVVVLNRFQDIMMRSADLILYAFSFFMTTRAAVNTRFLLVGACKRGS